jgi:hypothetical protein
MKWKKSRRRQAMAQDSHAFWILQKVRTLARFGSPGGPSITSRHWWVWVRFCVRQDFFYSFSNAESTVSTFNNTIEVKVYIHECIFLGCSVDTLDEISGVYKWCSAWHLFPPRFLRIFQHCSVLLCLFRLNWR